MSTRVLTGTAILLIGVAIGAVAAVGLRSDDDPPPDRTPISAAEQAVVDQSDAAQAAITHADAEAERAIEQAGQPAPHGVYVLRAMRGPTQRRAMLRSCVDPNRRTSAMCEAAVAISLGELEPGTYEPAALEAKLKRLRPLPTASELLDVTADTTCLEKVMDALKAGRISEGQDPYSYPDDLLSCVG